MKKLISASLLSSLAISSVVLAQDTGFRFRVSDGIPGYTLTADVYEFGFDDDTSRDTGQDIKLESGNINVLKLYPSNSSNWLGLANITITDPNGEKFLINKHKNSGEVKAFCSLDFDNVTVTGSHPFALVELHYSSGKPNIFTCDASTNSTYAW